jgi:hypothetical protein
MCSRTPEKLYNKGSDIWLIYVLCSSVFQTASHRIISFCCCKQFCVLFIWNPEMILERAAQGMFETQFYCEFVVFALFSNTMNEEARLTSVWSSFLQPFHLYLLCTFMHTAHDVGASASWVDVVFCRFRSLVQATNPKSSCKFKKTRNWNTIMNICRLIWIWHNPIRVVDNAYVLKR